MRSDCTAPGAAIRTLAYVVNTCRQEAEGFSGSQRLMVRRGNCAPVTIMEVPFAGPSPDPVGLCRAFGESRVGNDSVGIGVFQRIAALPDGSGVVFEVTSAFSLFPSLTPTPPAEGIFFVRSDGSGLRRLGPPTRVATFSLLSAVPIMIGSIEPFFATSPDGRTIAFTDLAPGPNGDALQIMTLDVASGRRRQLTHLSAVRARDGSLPTCCPLFIDERTVAFYPGMMVNTDGSGLAQLPSTVPVAGSRIIPRFGVTGNGTQVVLVGLAGKPVNPLFPLLSIQELFLLDGGHVLQLTSFQRTDTGLGALSGGRVFLFASADPLGTNPTGNCQVFSMDTFGGDLHQLTRFTDRRPSAGCIAGVPRSACWINEIARDPRSGTLVLASSCDPLGTNPFGYQVFAMRADGSGLRQLTAARGLTEDPDGTVRVELPGPVAYSGGVR